MKKLTALMLSLVMILSLCAGCGDTGTQPGGTDAPNNSGNAGTDVPENTPAAFALARQAGFGVELDLRLTADGETAIFHDPVLRRLCGREGGV